MKSLEFNKWAAAGLIGLIMVVASNVAGRLVFADHHTAHADHAEHAYPVLAEGEGAAAPEVIETEEPAALDPIAPLLASASAEAGAKFSKKCMACHNFDKGGANKVGPNLWGVVGADIAAYAGFSYSSALQALPGVWDYEHLNAFLANPKTYAPGTKMNYAGIKSAKDRADMIAYLRGLADAPQPLP